MQHFTIHASFPLRIEWRSEQFFYRCREEWGGCWRPLERKQMYYLYACRWGHWLSGWLNSFLIIMNDCAGTRQAWLIHQMPWFLHLLHPVHCLYLTLLVLIVTHLWMSCSSGVIIDLKFKNDPHQRAQQHCWKINERAWIKRTGVKEHTQIENKGLSSDSSAATNEQWATVDEKNRTAKQGAQR